jgi:hypothetical protein
MSFLSVLKTIGKKALTVTEKVIAVAANPAVEGIISVTPIGGAYTEAIQIITTLEALAPQSGVGPAKAAVAVPALQNVFPGANEAALTAFVADLVAAMNKFSAAAAPPAPPAPIPTP